MTQNQEILDHLQTQGPINPLLALGEYGCFRLAARISELKRDGWPIHSRMVSRRNRNGKRITFSEYTLQGVA